jgi:putative endonuclease
MDERFCVYIMANKRNGTSYVGVTNNLTRRVHEHRESLAQGFTSRYGLKMLVYYEVFDSISLAIQRETSLKRWPRRWKLALIEKGNPQWRDLAEEVAWLSSRKPPWMAGSSPAMELREEARRESLPRANSANIMSLPRHGRPLKRPSKVTRVMWNGK